MSIPVLQTVAAVNYLPFVLVLAESIQEQFPGARLSVLLTDASPGVVAGIRGHFGADIDFLGCGDLEVDHLDSMRKYYSILEFNSACKILALDYQTRMLGRPECLFIDPDMFAMGDFVTSARALDRDIVVTPHTLAPYPEDHELPNEMELATAGQVNGGYLFVRGSAATGSAIAWLVRQTRYNWFVAPSYGLYADQQWLSLLPLYFPSTVALLRDPGINIAYWNLHERRLRYAAANTGDRGKNGTGVMMVETTTTDRARLFHFSGLPMQGNGRLTQHSGRHFDADTESVIATHIQRYQAALLAQRGRVMQAGIAGDLGFSRQPLLARMKIAQKRWGVRHTELAPPPGRLGRLGGALDKWLS